MAARPDEAGRLPAETPSGVGDSQEDMMLVKLTYRNGVTEITDPVDSGLVTADELVSMSETEVWALYYGTSGDHGVPVDVEIDDTADRLERIANAPVRWDWQLKAYTVNHGGRADDEYGWTPVTADELEAAR